MLNIQNPFRNLPPVTQNLLILNVAIFIFMLIPGAQHALDRWLAVYYFTSADFYPWQLFTYMFLHGNFGHLFFNMFALLIFGPPIERAMGSPRYLFYYLTCGICAALVQMGVFAWVIHDPASEIHNQALLSAAMRGDIAEASDIFDSLPLTQREDYYTATVQILQYVNIPMVGASGAIYGVLLAFGFLFPNVPVYIFFIPVPIKAKWLIVGYFILEFVSGINGLNMAADNVAHFAHLGGMIFGLLLLLYWKKKGVFNNHWFF